MMRALVVIAATVMWVPIAQAGTCEHGNITFGVPVPTPVWTLIEAVAPGAVPHGLFYYQVEAIGGASFSLKGDDGETPILIGNGNGCPGAPGDAWIACLYVSDYDIHFACPGHQNRAGDEYGVVPCTGTGHVIPAVWGFAESAPVSLHIEGTTSLGEGFVYCES